MAEPAYVTFRSEQPALELTARLVGKPYCTPPRPRTQTQERIAQKSLTHYVGHEPEQMELPIKLDAPGGASVEKLIEKLHDFVSRKRWAGRYEPPIVRVSGRTVPRTGLQWKMSEITEERARALFQADGDRYLYVATVTLTEHVEDELLPESLKALNARGRGRGITTRTTTARVGETSLYDVARRVFRDPSRAGDIARQNPQIKSLGARLKQGQRIRLP